MIYNRCQYCDLDPQTPRGSNDRILATPSAKIPKIISMRRKSLGQMQLETFSTVSAQSGHLRFSSISIFVTDSRTGRFSDLMRMIDVSAAFAKHSDCGEHKLGKCLVF